MYMKMSSDFFGFVDLLVSILHDFFGADPPDIGRLCLGAPVST